MKFLKAIGSFFSILYKAIGFSNILNIILVLLLAFSVFKQCGKSDRDSGVVKRKDDKVSPTVKEAEEVKRKVDTAGREVVIYLEAEPIIEKIVDNSKVDSIAKIAGIEAKNAKAVTIINGELRKQNLELKMFIETMVDGLKDTSFRYKDRWIEIDAINNHDTSLNIRKIWADVSVNKVDFDKKKYWFFGRNENYSSVWFNSPYLSPTSLSTLKLKNKDPFFDFGVNVDAKYLNTPKELLMGPSVKLDIGRLNIGVGYYLNPGGNLGNTLMYSGGYKLY